MAVAPPSLSRSPYSTLKPARAWLLSFAIWTALALLAVTQAHFSLVQRGVLESSTVQEWLKLLSHWLPRYWIWAAFTPPIFWLAHTHLIRRDHVSAGTLYHVGAGLVVAALAAVAHSLVICSLWPHPSVWSHIQKTLVSSLADGVVTYWVVLLAAHAYAFRTQARDRELAAATLAARLNAAELATLRLQLNPHFLFNALNSLATLMREDVLGAEQLLERLSAFLRAVLAEPGREQISLREELAILDHYVEVERSRFGDRLRIQHEFPPEMLEAALPRMILQPLVENAIKHGVAMRRGSGLIKIEAQKTDGLVMLSVSDDGPGWPEKVNSAKGETHIGLANTRHRLEKAYGDRHRVDLLRSTQGGAVVKLQFPYSRYRDVQ